MFCDKCGKKISEDSTFCEHCGALFLTQPTDNLFIDRFIGFFSSIYKKFNLSKPIYIAALLIAVFIIFGSFLSYLYTQIQYSLKETQKELSLLRASTTDAFAIQQKSITEQGEKLSTKEDDLQKARANEALLRKTLDNVQKSQVSNSVGNTSNTLLNNFAPSVVKIFCRANAYSNDIQQGSGVLYHTNNSSTGLGPYYVTTNLHLVSTTDSSVSQCFIVVYPDYKSNYYYLLFGSESYKLYRSDIDVAFLKPNIITNDTNAGNFNDLAKFAREEGSICDSASIGDRLSILGYPGIGGETLTVTDGIVSGFEFDGRVRYLKTSAKIDYGNSGGIAIKDSGCLLGIPTYVQQGKIESIGRVLDLNYLYSVTLK